MHVRAPGCCVKSCADADKPMNLNDHLKTLETPGIPESQRWHSLSVILRELMEAQGVDLDYDTENQEPDSGDGWFLFGAICLVLCFAAVVAFILTHR